MSLAESKLEVEYPETDGRPMGETDLHIHWMIRVRDMLKRRYRGQRVYVASNLLLYFREGYPRWFIAPDVFVVKNCDPGFRRVYKVWEEGQPPHVVLEVTSRATQADDEAFKPQKYAQMGVAEYWMYDPSGEYLDPALQGFRLVDDYYQPIEPDAQRRLHCQQLNLWLRLEDGDLVIYDSKTGERLLTGDEAEQVAREAERAAREAERAERDAKESERAAREAAEAELRKLREELRRSK